jgi:hypothetical protein
MADDPAAVAEQERDRLLALDLAQPGEREAEVLLDAAGRVGRSLCAVHRHPGDVPTVVELVEATRPVAVELRLPVWLWLPYQAERAGRSKEDPWGEWMASCERRSDVAFLEVLWPAVGPLRTDRFDEELRFAAPRDAPGDQSWIPDWVPSDHWWFWLPYDPPPGWRFREP